ncbi:hypothetical protein LCGC14_0343310 [marine sediment metagenome]|uniref:Uncharacterized protein n=1 Tax=marine sediment metagenome TaxID=412755 RepID=A0A0F9WKW0_9ZZZZ
MPHNKAAASVKAYEESKKGKYAKSHEYLAKAKRIATASAKVKKARAAQKAAQAKLSPRQSLLQKVGKSLSKFRKSMSGDSASTKKTKSGLKAAGVRKSETRKLRGKGY